MGTTTIFVLIVGFGKFLTPTTSVTVVKFRTKAACEQVLKELDTWRARDAKCLEVKD